MAPGSATDSRRDVTYLDEIADRASRRRTLGADGTDLTATNLRSDAVPGGMGDREQDRRQEIIEEMP